MDDKKYASIQFTIKDFNYIKTIQGELEKEIGVKLSLAQTVMYCVDKLGKLQSIKKQLNQYEAAEANQKALKEATEYYDYKKTHNVKNTTVKEIFLQAQQIEKISIEGQQK